MTHPVVAGLADADPATRREACRRAVDDPAATLLLEPLSAALGDRDAGVARAAAEALVSLAGRVDGVGAVLRESLTSDARERRLGAAFALARLEPPGPRLLPVLVEGLASDDGHARWAAARVLVDAGRLHGDVLPLLLGLVRRAEAPVVRRMAGFCLRSLAPERPDAAAALLAAARDDDRHVRRAALTALAALWEPPARVVERLLQVAEGDPDLASRRIAVLALGELATRVPDPVADDCARRLEALAGGGEEDGLRGAARRSLARIRGEEAPRPADG